MLVLLALLLLSGPARIVIAIFWNVFLQAGIIAAIVNDWPSPSKSVQYHGIDLDRLYLRKVNKISIGNPQMEGARNTLRVFLTTFRLGN